MKTVHYPADQRGRTKIAWLDSHHSFSFGNYYDPKRMGFGTLRVLNDDRVAPANGFGMHP
ncbi:MAG: pirin family protein, partial [Candidatus Diapherotrites archaeon]|nr:pirin family protein [Candidatus Diapherotrites archaeon]